MMKKIKYKRAKIHNLQLEYNGNYTQNNIELQVFKYNLDFYTEKNDSIKTSLLDYHNEKRDKQQIWANIHGLHDANTIRKIGESIGIAPFILSEILNVNRRDSIELFEEMAFFSIKSIIPQKDKINFDELKLEQISFLLFENELISFQEHKSDFFGHIRDRIRGNVGLVRQKNADFLLFLLFEAIVENYFITLEHLENQLEIIQNKIKLNPKTDILTEIQAQKNNLQYLKKSIIPFREILSNVPHLNYDNQIKLVKTENQLFFYRLQHRCSEIIDQIDYDTNNLDSTTSLYFSLQNQRLNEIMKSLTVVSMLFMPLTFIAGIYGMNFKNIPEMEYDNAYFIVLGFMFCLSCAMLIYFKKRKWF